MKYYIADDEDPEFAASEQRYVDYIRSVWSMLPPDLQLLCDRRASFSPQNIYLNDSNVQRVHADFGRRTVQIALLGESLAEDCTQIGTRQFTLNYGQVQDLTYDGKYDNEFPFGVLQSDHIWDEIEVLKPGLFEHRMLFAGSGWVELSVVFREISVTYADTLHAQSSQPAA